MSKVALVTGGTRGIGAAISLALKKEGCNVAATYSSNSDAANKFSSENGIEVFQWNVADAAACEAGVKQVADKLGTVDILVNNAGISKAFSKVWRRGLVLIWVVRQGVCQPQCCVRPATAAFLTYKVKLFPQVGLARLWC